MKYNTSEIRAAARKIDNLADQLQSVRTSKVTKVSSSAKPLKGETANALQNQLDSLSADILSVRKNLDQCAAELYDFARRLDIADAKAKAMVTNS